MVTCNVPMIVCHQELLWEQSYTAFWYPNVNSKVSEVLLSRIHPALLWSRLNWWQLEKKKKKSSAGVSCLCLGYLWWPEFQTAYTHHCSHESWCSILPKIRPLLNCAVYCPKWLKTKNMYYNMIAPFGEPEE